MWVGGAAWRWRSDGRNDHRDEDAHATACTACTACTYHRQLRGMAVLLAPLLKPLGSCRCHLLQRTDARPRPRADRERRLANLLAPSSIDLSTVGRRSTRGAHAVNEEVWNEEVCTTRAPHGLPPVLDARAQTGVPSSRRLPPPAPPRCEHGRGVSMGGVWGVSPAPPRSPFRAAARALPPCAPAAAPPWLPSSRVAAWPAPRQSWRARRRAAAAASPPPFQSRRRPEWPAGSTPPPQR